MYFNRFRSRIPIVLYHRVSPHPNKYWSPLTPNAFEKQIRLLSKKYKFASLDDLFSKTRSELRNSCIIVFDDAFKDFYEYALPILRKHKVPVTLFVPVDCIDNEKIIWTSELDNSFKYTTQTELNLTIGGKKIVFDISSEPKKISEAFRVQKLLISLPDIERKKQFEHIINILGGAEDKDISMMTWTDIIQTKKDVNYQSHTMTHPILSKIESEKTIEYELKDSHNQLVEKLDKNIDYIAYPVGEWSDKVLTIVQKYYKAGFAVNDDLVELPKLDQGSYRYAIPRVNVSDSNPRELFLRINGFHKFITR